MVVYPADGAVSADPVPACVEAGEGESVAVLVLRTVVVLQAVHVAAPALVGVAGKQAGWARTLKSHDDKIHFLFTDGARSFKVFNKSKLTFPTWFLATQMAPGPHWRALQASTQVLLP